VTARNRPGESDVVPQIETARLRLRGFQTQDLDAILAINNHPDVVRFIGGKPMPREELWRRLTSAVGLWALGEYGFWVVERKADGAIIGQAGFGNFKRDITPSLDGMPEMGWIFAADVHGQGFASEAVAGAIAWGRENLAASTYCCIIDPANTASIRLAEKAGFGDPVTGVYKDEPILVFRRPARG